MAATRISRSDSKARTRAGLLAAARRVFLRRGFHKASLEEIADEAGYTKGAVYSNFAGKDDLFLALLEEHYAQRIAAHRSLMLDLAPADAEETARAIARIIFEAYEREPTWWTLVADFSTHASRDAELRHRLRSLRENFLGAMAELIEIVGERHRLDYALPAHEIGRAIGALLRGLMLDWILEHDEPARARLFEDTVVAFLRGAAGPLDQRSTT